MSQSQISRTLRNEVSVSRIAAILSKEKFDSRRALARRICEAFSFVDAAGRLQVAGCMQALSALSDRSPDIVLPPPRSPPVNNRPLQLACDVPAPVGVPGRLAGVEGLHIQLIDRAEDRAV